LATGWEFRFGLLTELNNTGNILKVMLGKEKDM